jgi:hypothetical protein
MGGDEEEEEGRNRDFYSVFVFLWVRVKRGRGIQHPGSVFRYFSLEMNEKGIQHPIVAYG